MNEQVQFKAQDEGRSEVVEDMAGLDMAEILARLWRRRLWVIGSVLLSMALASLYLHLATPRYTTTLVVTPANENAARSLANQFGGLASLAGVALPMADSTPFSLYPSGARSLETAQRVAADETLLRGAFPNEWDPAGKRWHEPKSAIGGLVKAVKAALGFPITPWVEPGASRMQEFIHQNVNVAEEPKKSLITLSIEDPDPAFSEALLLSIHKAVDDQLRQRTLARANDNIAYLTTKIATVQLAEHRAALAGALAEQERASMAANSTVPFAAEAFGDPATSRRPTYPRATLALLGAALLGLFLSALVVVAVPEHRSPQQ